MLVTRKVMKYEISNPFTPASMFLHVPNKHPDSASYSPLKNCCNNNLREVENKKKPWRNGLTFRCVVCHWSTLPILSPWRRKKSIRTLKRDRDLLRAPKAVGSFSRVPKSHGWIFECGKFFFHGHVWIMRFFSKQQGDGKKC